MTVFSTNESVTATLSFNVLDHNSVAVQPDTITLTFYDRVTGGIINSRDGQNVLNANNVVITSGALVWSMQILDNPIVTITLDSEIHVALWEWTYSSGARSGKQEVLIRVQNLTKVT